MFHAVRRHRNFRLLWTAALIAQLGQWLRNIALGWLAPILTDSPAFVGRVGFAAGLPILLLSLPAGVLLDRVDRRRTLIACQVTGAALAAGIAIFAAQGRLAAWSLLAAAFLSGGLVAFTQPATQALTPALVPRADLANALALTSAGNSSTRIIGPSLAGAPIGAVGIAGCFASQAGILTLATALTVALRLPARDRDHTRAAVGGGLLDGLRAIRNDRTLTGLLLLAAAPALLAYPYVQLMPVFARNVLDLGPRGLGLLMATTGVGALAGALLVAALGAYPHKGRLTLVLGIVYGCFLTGFAQSPWPLVSAAVGAGASFLGSAFYSLNVILVQTNASDALRGRVLGALTLTFGLMPIGTLLIGELADRIGVQWAVTGGSLGSSLCIALMAWHFRSLVKL